MAGHAWAGAGIRSAASRQRTALRQAAALAGLMICGLTLLAAAPAGVLVQLIVALAAVGLIGELALALRSRHRLAAGCDELILQGYQAEGRSDPVSAAVRTRRSRLLGPRRRLLITALRFQMAEAAERHWQFRAPVSRYPDLLERIVAALERDAADARAVILLERLVCEPDPETIGRARGAGSVEQRLREVLAMLRAETGRA